MDLYFYVENGKIIQLEIYSDCLSVEFIAIIKKVLQNVPYDLQAMRAALGVAQAEIANAVEDAATRRELLEAHLPEFTAWLLQAI